MLTNEEEQFVKELFAENRALKLENTQIKTELCLKDKTYSWCK